ncbi:MAG: Xanthine dehydrogenase, binding subunit [Ilumatobacteraceae bacterium]|nr:Xanthine dehydrogenase, binding subunit [Ilumatobacteraceae bacterium]
MTFTIATTLDDALAAMAAGARPVAGGSDLVVAARHGKAPLPGSIVAIDRLGDLAQITGTADGVRIGALATHATLMRHPLIVDSYPGLADASALVGSPATRNVGTLGGNVMNSSPAMDTGAPLLALGASVELRSVTGTRIVPLGELWTGPGRNVAAADELCTAVLIPAPATARGTASSSAYVRLEYRRAMEIAVVGAGASITVAADGTVESIAIALTAVAPTIISVTGLDAFVGKPLDVAALAAVGAIASEQASPISDLRASDSYRRHCVGVMARRAAEAAARRAGGELIAIPVNRAFGIGAAR